jgi:hypothetical protein
MVLPPVFDTVTVYPTRLPGATGLRSAVIASWRSCAAAGTINERPRIRLKISGERPLPRQNRSKVMMIRGAKKGNVDGRGSVEPLE